MLNFPNAERKKRKKMREQRSSQMMKRNRSDKLFDDILKRLEESAELPSPISNARIDELERESGDCFDGPVEVCVVCGMFPKPGTSCKKANASKFAELSKPLKRTSFCDQLLVDQHKFPDIKTMSSSTAKTLSDVWVCPLGIDAETGGCATFKLMHINFDFRHGEYLWAVLGQFEERLNAEAGICKSVRIFTRMVVIGQLIWARTMGCFFRL